MREIVKIDESKCDGCGNCIPNCHEGALQIIDGKARLVSDLLCDGLGACIGHCPQDAITIEKREAEEYNEKKVMELIIPKGKNTVIAHIKHLIDHNEAEYAEEALNYIKEREDKLDFNMKEIIGEVMNEETEKHQQCHSGACPGSAERTFETPDFSEMNMEKRIVKSELTHWPVQMHLINPNAHFFRGKDLLIAADCTAFSYGDFHNKFVKGKSMIIACPKLDNGVDIYVEKLIQLIDIAKVNTINVAVMEVPCCHGLVQIIKNALSKAERKVPVKLSVIGIQGEIVQENWI